MAKKFRYVSFDGFPSIGLPPSSDVSLVFQEKYFDTTRETIQKYSVRNIKVSVVLCQYCGLRSTRKSHELSIMSKQYRDCYNDKCPSHFKVLR